MNLDYLNKLMRLGIYKALLIWFFFISGQVHGKEPRVVIVYPGSETSRAQIYGQVIEGIEKELGPTEQFEVPEGSGDIEAQLDRLHPEKIIALGKKIAEAVNKTAYREQSLVGLAHFKAQGYNGVSLALDNSILCKQLSRFLPSVERVIVVQQSGYQAINNNPTTPCSSPKLEVREGGDSLATIRMLGHLVEGEATATDAVIIPANLPIDILYEVAKVAWDKKIILLSTNLDQLDTGTLMVFYPNPVALGTQLGQLVTKKKPGYESVKSIDSALNKVVAQHLSIDFDPKILDLITVKIK
ncbi:MAG: hypothetical protein ABL903_19955 [Methylococcales bacterium]